MRPACALPPAGTTGLPVLAGPFWEGFFTAAFASGPGLARQATNGASGAGTTVLVLLVAPGGALAPLSRALRDLASEPLLAGKWEILGAHLAYGGSNGASGL